MPVHAGIDFMFLPQVWHINMSFWVLYWNEQCNRPTTCPQVFDPGRIGCSICLLTVTTRYCFLPPSLLSCLASITGPKQKVLLDKTKFLCVFVLAILIVRNICVM